MSGIVAQDWQARPDLLLEHGFSSVTNGQIVTPNLLQTALFPRLMTQDNGLIVPTGPAAGRLEAIFVPFILHAHPDDVAHRLYIITADGAPLDDYLYRLGPYMSGVVALDGIERILWLQEPNREAISLCYDLAGSSRNFDVSHPFTDGVDVVIMPFSHFRTQFFGNGGVNAVPESVGFDRAMSKEMKPRGLFYFDEAFGPARADQLEFIRLVEFLFAQDLDVIVGGSTLSQVLMDDLSYLDQLGFPESAIHPKVLFQQILTTSDNLTDKMLAYIEIERASDQSAVIVLNNLTDQIADSVNQRIAAFGWNNTFIYRADNPISERYEVYAKIMEIEALGKPHIVITDGSAIEASDFDFALVVSEICHPLNILRRAGRCNRRGRLSEGRMTVFGDPKLVTESTQVPMSSYRQEAFLDGLAKSEQPAIFEADYWKRLVA